MSKVPESRTETVFEDFKNLIPKHKHWSRQIVAYIAMMLLASQHVLRALTFRNLFVESQMTIPKELVKAIFDSNILE